VTAGSLAHDETRLVLHNAPIVSPHLERFREKRERNHQSNGQTDKAGFCGVLIAISTVKRLEWISVGGFLVG
jgi:hypothetical protein